MGPSLTKGGEEEVAGKGRDQLEMPAKFKRDPLWDGRKRAPPLRKAVTSPRRDCAAIDAASDCEAVTAGAASTTSAGATVTAEARWDGGHSSRTAKKETNLKFL